MNNDRIIFLADCQSFYASIEKAAHPAYRNKPLVVAGDPKRRSGIVLAACPLAKQLGVTTAEPLWQAYQKCADLIVVQPRMKTYIDVSLQIMSILESYSELVEPFSVDEQFVYVSNSLTHFKCSPSELAQHIRMRVRNETGINTRIGIGSNKILAKMACDNFAKKNTSGIFELTRSNLSELWDFPVNRMFGVGTRTRQHLSRIGIHTIGQLAHTPLPQLQQQMKRLMKKNCDVWSEVLWRTANGYDNSPVTPDAFEQQQGIGRQTTLPVDYRTQEDIDVVLSELSMLICHRARAKGYLGTVVHVGAQGADFGHPTGFSRQLKLLEPTHITREVYTAAKKLFALHWDGQPVRRISVSLNQLQSDSVYQLTMFDDRERQRKLEHTMDDIQAAYGPGAIFLGSSLKQASQMKFLGRKIGGHYK